METVLQKVPAVYWLEGSVLLGKNSFEALAEGFQLEVTENGEACRESLTAVKEALVKDTRAVQACEASMTLEDFLREVTEDSAASRAQKAASVQAARMNCAPVAVEGDSLKGPGCYLTAVFDGVLFSGGHRSQLLTQ